VAVRERTVFCAVYYYCTRPKNAGWRVWRVSVSLAMRTVGAVIQTGNVALLAGMGLFPGSTL